MDEQERSEQYWRNFERMWPIGEEADAPAEPAADPAPAEPEPVTEPEPVEPEPAEPEPVMEPADEPEQTFGQSQYIHRGEPVQYAIPAEAPKKKKKKKRISGVAVAVTALLCMLSALLGAFLGGSLVKRSIPVPEAPAQVDPTLESRIKAL